MVNVRFHPDVRPGPGSRFNVLLAEDRINAPYHWSRQLPRLMEPLGVRSYLVRSGQEALDLVESTRIHAAVVDLATPRVAAGPESPAPAPQPHPASVQGGLWILELFKRLRHTPPVVLIRSRAIMQRDIDRLLRDALRLGAFTVLENPVNLENLLNVFRRLLDSQYHGNWPLPPGNAHGDANDVNSRDDN